MTCLQYLLTAFLDVYSRTGQLLVIDWVKMSCLWHKDLTKSAMERDHFWAFKRLIYGSRDLSCSFLPVQINLDTSAIKQLECLEIFLVNFDHISRPNCVFLIFLFTMSNHFSLYFPILDEFSYTCYSFYRLHASAHAASFACDFELCEQMHKRHAHQ